jgi:hypothetical protein
VINSWKDGASEYIGLRPVSDFRQPGVKIFLGTTKTDHGAPSSESRRVWVAERVAAFMGCKFTEMKVRAVQSNIAREDRWLAHGGTLHLRDACGDGRWQEHGTPQ